MNDIILFCCGGVHSFVLCVDTTFKFCDMWFTDIWYKNKRIINTKAVKHSVINYVSLLQDEHTFNRFALECLSANPLIYELKSIGEDLESAIFSVFKSTIKPFQSCLVFAIFFKGTKANWINF